MPLRNQIGSQPASATSQLMTPAERASVAQMQLSAQRTIGGLSGGRHRSASRGASSTFKEHRQYVPGDPLRILDWKLYGKTDRLFVRQYEDEANLRVMLLLDQSASMAFSSDVTQANNEFAQKKRNRTFKQSPQPRSLSVSGQTKHDYARRLAACFATLCIQQQDPVGLITFDHAIRTMIPPRNRRSHLAHVMRELVRSSPADKTNVSTALREAMARIQHRRSTIVVFSDLLDEPNQLIDGVQAVTSRGHEVVIFQVWDPLERDFPFEKLTEFKSLEKPQHIVRADASAIKTHYLQRVAQYQNIISTAFTKSSVDFIPCTTAENPTDVLRRYLNQRNQPTPANRRIPGGRK